MIPYSVLIMACIGSFMVGFILSCFWVKDGGRA